MFYKQNLVGIQGRSLDFRNPKSVKYITVMINDDAPKIYGLDDVELDGPVYVTEGPFDSTFIENSIAMCGVLMVTLVSGVLAILFGFMITNHAIEKSSQELREPLAKEIL